MKFCDEFAAANENDFAVEQIAQYDLVEAEFSAGGDCCVHDLNPMFYECVCRQRMELTSGTLR